MTLIHNYMYIEQRNLYINREMWGPWCQWSWFKWGYIYIFYIINNQWKSWKWLRLPPINHMYTLYCQDKMHWLACQTSALGACQIYSHDYSFICRLSSLKFDEIQSINHKPCIFFMILTRCIDLQVTWEPQGSFSSILFWKPDTINIHFESDL